MNTRALTLAASAAAGLMAAIPASANAAMAFTVLPQSLTRTTVDTGQACDARVVPAIGVVPSATPVRRMDKSSAILGGRTSALEKMRQQQAGTATPEPTGLAATSAPSRLGSAATCQKFTLPMAEPMIAATGTIRVPAGSDDFLASKRLAVRHTSFDAQWNRVRSEGLSPRIVAGLAGVAPGGASVSTLAAVNAWANARIRYVEDRDLYGQADYWASASTTLRQRAGDCEDIAIAKMQLLAALGVAHSDMYLTVARDLVRNADHAVLIVKLDGKHWLLDNSTNELLDASRSNDYRPIMSFSQSHKWLHGYSRL